MLFGHFFTQSHRVIDNGVEIISTTMMIRNLKNLLPIVSDQLTIDTLSTTNFKEMIFKIKQT